jgi:hypothetical protein
VKHRRKQPSKPRKPVIGDDLGSVAERTRVAAMKAGDDLRDATQSAVDQTWATAKQVFEHIKATHARAEKGVQ